MAEEALRCFESLLESVPKWLADLESILKAAAEHQQEIVFANQPASDKGQSRRASKASSLQSKQSKQPNTKEGSGIGLRMPRLKRLTNSDALRLSQRKRKTASVCSGDESGPPQFRSKAAAVVYYDGDTQKRFDQLVRGVGSSRNAIRKGKMSAKVESLARLEPSSSSSEATSNSGSGEEGEYSLLTGRLDSKQYRPGISVIDRKGGVSAFDRVDDPLSKAQSMCERAAHQVLRDGDCTLEVTNAKEHFSDALKMAEAELPAIRKLAETVAERRRRSEERRRCVEEEADMRACLNAADPGLSDKVHDLAAAIAVPSEDQLEGGELEVDDENESGDDDGQGEFNLSAAQFGRFGQMRTARLAAH